MVRYIEEQPDNHFTFNKEYVCKITTDGLMVIDDLDGEHIIATKKNPYKSYQEDDFFRHKFEFV